MTQQTHSFGRISLSVPSQWTDNTMINLVGPPQGRFRPNVTVTRQVVPLLTSLGVFGRQQTETIEQSGLPEFEILEEELVRIGDHKYYLLRFHWTHLLDPNTDPPEVDRLYQAQYTTLHDGTAYTITFTCLAEYEAELEPLCEEIVESFQVT